ncbi:MAG: DUF898 family protein [Burkholderiales bacterium]|nr:DUF898 family protein [Burkholderiales bacterium]
MTHDPDLEDSPASDDGVPRLPRGEVVRLSVDCTIDAQEYARIWIVNVLCTVLTLGVYLPWARVRTQRYFLRRTFVGGDAFDYHATPTSLLFRYGLALCLMGGVAGAWVGSPLSGLLALSLALIMMPLLQQVGFTHRMAHTSWAGRRLSFDGQFTGGIYSATLLPLVGVTAVAWLILAAETFQRPWLWAAAGFLAGVCLLGMPMFYWATFQYRQQRVRLGPLRLSWKASYLSMLMLWVRIVAWAVLVSMLVVGVGAVLLAGLLLTRWPSQHGWWLGLSCVLAVAVLVVVLPYVQARMQNLVWSNTGNRALRFHSKLSVSGYVSLQVRHALLLVLTLGLYWPWAVVASRRMRTQALEVSARVDVEVLKAHWPKGPMSA